MRFGGAARGEASAVDLHECGSCRADVEEGRGGAGEEAEEFVGVAVESGG